MSTSPTRAATNPDNLMVGCGFAGLDQGYVLVQCLECHRFGASRQSSLTKRGSHCRSRRVRVFEEVGPDGPLLCPACGEPTVVIRETG